MMMDGFGCSRGGDLLPPPRLIPRDFASLAGHVKVLLCQPIRLIDLKLSRESMKISDVIVRTIQVAGAGVAF